MGGGNIVGEARMRILTSILIIVLAGVTGACAAFLVTFCIAMVTMTALVRQEYIAYLSDPAQVGAALGASLAAIILLSHR